MQVKRQEGEQAVGRCEAARGPARLTADDWAEESGRQARELEHARLESDGVYGEFRRKLARGEVMSASAEKLTAAVRFSGRITLTFHQGKLTKTILEEAHYGGRKTM